MALVETFTDGFADLSNWTVLLESDGTISAAGTLDMNHTGDSTIYIYSSTGYDFQESWLSIEIVSMDDTASGYSIFTMGAVDAGVSALITINLAYDASVDQFTLQAPAASAQEVFANPGVSFHIGFKVESGTLRTGWSTDSGASWFEVGSGYAWTDPAGDTAPRVLIGGQALSADVPFDTLFDNLNAVEVDNFGATPPAAKIETYVEDFTSGVLFGVSGSDGGSEVVDPGKLHGETTGDGGITALSLSKYSYTDTWASILVEDIYDGVFGVSGAESFAQIKLSGDTTTRGLMARYYADEDEVRFSEYDAPGTVFDTVPNPGSFHMGINITGSVVKYGYKLSTGDWIALTDYALPVIDTAEECYVELVMGAEGVTSAQFIMDDYNVEEVPSFEAILIDLSTPGSINFAGVTLDDVLLGGFIVRPDPGIIRFAGKPLTVSLGPLPPTITIIPGQIIFEMMDFDPIVGAFVLGDPFQSPFDIRESGTATYDMTDMTLQTGEPTTAHDRSAWVRYTADGPMTATFTATSADPFTLEVFEGGALADLVEAQTGATVTQDINTGHTYLRLTSSTDTDITLDWSYVLRIGGLMMDVLTPEIDLTPADVQVSVIGGFGSEEIKFTWSPSVSDLIPGATSRPITLATIRSDTEGNILLGTLPIQPVYHGTYTITAKGLSSGYSAVGTFKVLNDPLPQDSDPNDVAPEEVVGVNWFFDDAAGHTWAMDINPSTMESIVFPKAYLAERSTSGDGQNIIWQGTVAAKDWGFAGVLFSQAEQDELLYYYNLDRKFYITTHRGQTLIVTFVSLDITPKKNQNNFWTWQYTGKLFLFGEVT